jgi:hypothetical protein
MGRPHPRHWSRDIANCPPAPTTIRRTCTCCRVPKVLLGGRKTPTGWKCAICVPAVVRG